MKSDIRFLKCAKVSTCSPICLERFLNTLNICSRRNPGGLARNRRLKEAASGLQVSHPLRLRQIDLNGTGKRFDQTFCFGTRNPRTLPAAQQNKPFLAE